MGSFKGGERKDGLEGAMRTTQTPHSRKARTVIIDTWANFFILFLPPAIRPRQEIHLFPVLIKYVYFFIVHLFIENIALQSWFYREGSFRFSLCLAQSQDIFSWYLLVTKTQVFLILKLLLASLPPQQNYQAPAYSLVFNIFFIWLLRCPYSLNTYFKSYLSYIFQSFTCFILMGHSAKNVHLLSHLKNGQVKKFIWRPKFTM